jgi:hypothetical protein
MDPYILGSSWAAEKGQGGENKDCSGRETNDSHRIFSLEVGK